MIVRHFDKLCHCAFKSFYLNYGKTLAEYKEIRT